MSRREKSYGRADNWASRLPLADARGSLLTNDAARVSRSQPGKRSGAFAGRLARSEPAAQIRRSPEHSAARPEHRSKEQVSAVSHSDAADGEENSSRSARYPHVGIR